MKIVTTMRGLPIGGSIITALELAAAMRDEGHEVTVVAGDGPASGLAHELGIPTLTSSGGLGRFAALLRRSLRDGRPDVVHAWDWQAVATTHLVASVGAGLPMIGSITAIDPTPYLPDGVPVGFVSEIMRRRDPRPSSPNFCQNMPINTDTDRPGIIDSAPLARELGVRGDRVNAVLVTRMARYMKLESILSAIAAMEYLVDVPVDLTIVGGGEAEAEVRAAAEAMNHSLGEPRIRFTGELLDPRPAYDLADIVIGMGSSILRGMSFGTPAIVVGESGFALTVTPENVDAVNDVGYYGLSEAATTGAKRLAVEITDLVDNPSRATELGRFNREHVVAHHDTRVVAGGLLDQIVTAHRRGPVRSAGSLARNGSRFCGAVCRTAAERVASGDGDLHDDKPQEYRELT